MKRGPNMYGMQNEIMQTNDAQVTLKKMKVTRNAI